MDSSKKFEGDQEDGGPWSEVQYRKNRKSKGDGVEWTFLVQNISERVTRNIMWRAFQPYGYVSDAYVARKRDAKGKCFGFVRYVGVENLKGTLVSMNTVKMFGMKAYVTLAKYDRDHKRFNFAPTTDSRREWRPKVNNQPYRNVGDGTGFGEQTHAKVQTSGQTSGSMQDGMTYADMLRGRKEPGYQGAKSITVEGRGALYPLHCIGRSIVGIAKDVWTLKNIRRLLEVDGLIDFGVTYVGGLSIILTLKDKATAMESLEKYDSVFAKVFSKRNIWNGEEIPFGRIVNLSITGVPVLIRDNNLFDRIGSLFGDIVQPSKFSWQEEDVSVNTVKVLSSQKSRIEESVVIKWNHKSHVIWVTESPERWVPFFEDDSSKNLSGSDSDSESDSEEESVDMEDLEEGEFRSDGADVPVPEHEYGPPADEVQGEQEVNGKTSDNQEATVHKKSAEINGEPFLHGNVEEHMHAAEDINVGGGGILKSNIVDGPPSLDPEMDITGPDNPLVKEGPTPGAYLGKRSRDELSPPSIGSIQGPSQRTFFQSQESPNIPIDLNTPVKDNYGGEEGFPPTSGQQMESQGVNHRPEGSVNRSPVLGTAPVQPDPNLYNYANPEVQATVEVGAFIGINLNGFEDATERIIVEEGVNKSVQ
ncbi:putative RNA recognition motif domain, nucleotide-binding alpha-beta plait domain superfamily [Helianthus annuus]|nr:putative RNA recognition motif domain, nucleotide-binding alpha-beta plait domain superfamily [Helianthus annuus]